MILLQIFINMSKDIRLRKGADLNLVGRAEKKINEKATTYTKSTYQDEGETSAKYFSFKLDIDYLNVVDDR